MTIDPHSIYDAREVLNELASVEQLAKRFHQRVCREHGAESAFSLAVQNLITGLDLLRQSLESAAFIGTVPVGKDLHQLSEAVSDLGQMVRCIEPPLEGYQPARAMRLGVLLDELHSAQYDVTRTNSRISQDKVLKLVR